MRSGRSATPEDIRNPSGVAYGGEASLRAPVRERDGLGRPICFRFPVIAIPGPPVVAHRAYLDQVDVATFAQSEGGA
jgi:hypothetical protein